ncbi:MAG TPA: hypothetical protein VIE65_13005 [Methylobacter sp.]|jgi:hypothetical protein
MCDEKLHAGAVKSRIHETCMVAEPIVMTIEGKDIQLSLQDALALNQGLTAAIERATEHEEALIGDRTNYNIACIGNARSGMSLFRQSKLGDGKSFLIDGFLHANPFRNISKEQIQATIENPNIKPFFKFNLHDVPDTGK